MSEELEQFKRNIDLVQYAEKCGYAVDRRKSSKKNVIMRKGSEKIGIGINKKTGHQNFNDFSGGRGGTIIDFCQKETSKNLGQVRQELRQFAGMQKPERSYFFKSPDVLKKERKMQAEKLKQEKMRAESIVKSEYLEKRGISPETLNSQLFKNKVFRDQNNNVCFPHIKEKKFSGFEKKNTNFTAFSSGGEKGLWYSNAPAKIEKIVVCESAIDCMSHAQLKNSVNTAYVSVGGQMSQEQEKELQSLLERQSQDVEIVAAFDNDKNGEKYTEDLQKIAGDREVTRDLPIAKDFNEDLQQQKKEQEQDSKQIFREIAEQNSAPEPEQEQENENDYELEL